MKRRDSLLAAYALLAGATAQAGLFDPDVSEVEVGSTTSGVLDPQTSRRLTVRTKLVGIKTTTWVGRDGRIDPTMGSMTQHLYENKYDWQTSVQRATDIWRVTAEELKEPALMVLRVRSTQGAPLVVSLFPGASSPGQLDPETGIQVRPSEDASNEWLALFAFDPGAKTFVTVQAQDSERVPYRIAVLPAGRFRR
jgi:hypothetical protein